MTLLRASYLQLCQLRTRSELLKRRAPRCSQPSAGLSRVGAAGKGGPGRGRFRLSPAMASMAAVEHQRDQLARHTQTFTSRVATFLGEQFDAIAAQALAEVRGSIGEGHPVHRNIARKPPSRLQLLSHILLAWKLVSFTLWLPVKKGCHPKYLVGGPSAEAGNATSTNTHKA